MVITIDVVGSDRGFRYHPGVSLNVPGGRLKGQAQIGNLDCC